VKLSYYALTVFIEVKRWSDCVVLSGLKVGWLKVPASVELIGLELECGPCRSEEYGGGIRPHFRLSTACAALAARRRMIETSRI